MHRQVNSRLRSLRTTMGVGGEEIHELGLLSSRLKDIQDAGSDLVIAGIRKQGTKSTEEIDDIMTYKKASQNYHDTYVKPFMQGPGAKPQQTTFYKNSDEFQISLESKIIKILWSYGLDSHQLSLTGLAECAKRLNDYI